MNNIPASSIWPGSTLRSIMKVFLDDQRSAPQGWHRAYWPDEVIELLNQGQVTELSLDHDLGDDSRGTGYDVIRWIEEAVATRGFNPPKISIHSANPVGRDRMEQGLSFIARAIEKNRSAGDSMAR